MHFWNWILNLLDRKKRRTAVQTLASSHNRVVHARWTFHRIGEMYGQLCAQVAMLEQEGASPHDVLNCLGTMTELGRLSGNHSNELGNISIEFKSPLHKTAENAEFSERIHTCAAKLQRRVDVWMAEESQWLKEVPYDFSAMVSRIENLKTWQKMTGVEFENFIINKLQKQGFWAQATKVSGDEGIDIVAVWQGKPSEDGSIISNVSQGRKYLIQCKRYDAQNAIGQPLLREFYGSMKGMDATAEGIFITTSRFTDSAVEYAARMGIHIIDGAALDKMLRHPNYDT